MSDVLPDSPYLARQWCPTCEPERDPFTEILETRYCVHHEPGRAGEDDAGVTGGYISGGAESGGDANRDWCELFHRKSRLLTGGSAA